MPEGPAWLVIPVCLVAGFLLLTKGAIWLVGSSSQIARRLGVSTLVIGLTIIAFGTSAPEIVVSAVAAAEGKVDLSLGNVLGSNVANIGLVLGLCAVVLPRVLEARLAAREIGWLFASLFLLWGFALDGVIGRLEGGLLLAGCGLYLIHVLRTVSAYEREEEEAGEYARPLLWTVAGIVAIAAGAKLVVMGAERGSLALGIPQSVVGLTIVAVGTSLPELAAGLGGAFKGESDISIGNVVGSNVFNLMAVVGIVALVQPLDGSHDGLADPAALASAFEQALNEDFWVVLGFSVAAIVLPQLGPGAYGRAKGALLVVAYAAYTAWLFASR